MALKFDLAKLEEIFSKDFTSSVYNILAAEYLKNKDINRAYTVVKIGQEHHPSDVLGKYTLAKIYLLKNEITKSEKLLETVLARFPLHLNARKLLIEILKKKDASSDSLANHITKLQEYFPNEGIPTKSKKNTFESEENVAEDLNEKLIEDVESLEAESKNEKGAPSKLAIKKNMATFTLVDILISQKHFNGALEVLDILKDKGRNQDRIDEKVAEIKKRMNK